MDIGRSGVESGAGTSGAPTISSVQIIELGTAGAVGLLAPGRPASSAQVVACELTPRFSAGSAPGEPSCAPNRASPWRREEGCRGELSPAFLLSVEASLAADSLPRWRYSPGISGKKSCETGLPLYFGPSLCSAASHIRLYCSTWLGAISAGSPGPNLSQCWVGLPAG